MSSVAYPPLVADSANALQNVFVPTPQFNSNVMHTDAYNPNIAPDTIVAQCILPNAHFVGKKTDLTVPHGTPIVLVWNHADPARKFHKNEPLHTAVLGAYPSRPVSANGANNFPAYAYDDDDENTTHFLSVTVGMTTFFKNKACPVTVAVQNVCAVSTCHSTDPANSALLDAVDKASMTYIKTKAAVGDTIWLTFFQDKPVLLSPDNFAHIRRGDKMLVRKLVITEPHHPSTGCVRCDFQSTFRWECIANRNRAQGRFNVLV